MKRAANVDAAEPKSLRSAWDEWEKSGRAFWREMDAFVEVLNGLVERELADG